MNKIDIEALEKDSIEILRLARQKRDESLDDINVLPEEWPGSIRILNPKHVDIENNAVWINWIDHFGGYGIRSFERDVTKEEAEEASSFVRTFHVRKISNKLWFYIGD